MSRARSPEQPVNSPVPTPTPEHSRATVIHEESTSNNQHRPDSTRLEGACLQILATEHWSLLATRSLTYSESLSRVVMFLSVLSGVVVALALLAQVDHFDRTFTVAAALLLLIVLFVGVATIVRLSALNREDLRLVMGMNRLRRAYLDMHPELEPYFLMGSHDDLPGVMLTMDMHMAPDHWSAVDAGHEFQTLPAMLGVVVAVIAGVLGAVLAGWFGAETPTLVVVAATVFLLSIAVLGYWTRRTFTSFVQQMPTRFASTQSAQGCTQRRPSEASSSSAAAGPQEPAG